MAEHGVVVSGRFWTVQSVLGCGEEGELSVDCDGWNLCDTNGYLW